MGLVVGGVSLTPRNLYIKCILLVLFFNGGEIRTGESIALGFQKGS